MYPRKLIRRLRQALADTRVVMLAGPRQSGKTTLAHQTAVDGMPFYTFDDAVTLEAAQRDPVGFIRALDRAVIDEIQRVPQLLLPIKQSVDADRRPGRFLLTGSANVMTIPQVADSLAGRMEVLHLLPLAQCELRGTDSDFLDRVFAGQPPSAGEPVLGADLMELVLAGGYPEALERKSWQRRRDWHLSYIDLILRRDVRELAEVERLKETPKLLGIVAQHATRLVNYTTIGSPLDLAHKTTRRYIDLFEQVFLIRTLQPWSGNELNRLVKTPKVHFLDSGLLASIRGISMDRLREDKLPYGALLETFVLAELLKLASWSDNRFEFYHYRDKYKYEVDIVIEDLQGRVVGIEVKAGATVTAQDFNGLEKLATACGGRFVAGLILYDHDLVLPFGERLFAAPISTLWASSELSAKLSDLRR